LQKDDSFNVRKKALEEDYFRTKETAVIEKMRARAARDAERRQMGEELGVADEEILRDLQELGYTRDTLKVVHLVPLIQVAWADGKISAGEREQFIKAARSRGILENTPADDQLKAWLNHGPSDEVFQKTLRIIRALYAALPPEEREATGRDLLSYATRVAAGSGGILGLGNKISAEEREVLSRIAAEIEAANQTATHKLLKEDSSQ
jgi:hypothetical protein